MQPAERTSDLSFFFLGRETRGLAKKMYPTMALISHFFKKIDPKMAAALNGDDVAAVLEASGGVLFAVEPAIVWRPVRSTLHIDLCVSKC